MTRPVPPAAPRGRATALPARIRVTTGLLAVLAGLTPILTLVAPLAVTTVAAAHEDHPRWKDFVTWLMDRKRTPDEDLILRYILSGGSRFSWFDVYAHSMQEQTEAMFRRWLERDGNPRRNPDLGNRAAGDPKP